MPISEERFDRVEREVSDLRADSARHEEAIRGIRESTRKIEEATAAVSSEVRGEIQNLVAPFVEANAKTSGRIDDVAAKANAALRNTDDLKRRVPGAKALLGAVLALLSVAVASWAVTSGLLADLRSPPPAVSAPR